MPRGQHPWIFLQRLLVELLGFPRLPRRGLQRSQRVVRLGEVGREGDRLAVGILRVLAAIQPLIHQAEIVRQIRVLRCQPDGLLIGADRGGRIASLDVAQRQVVERIGPVLRAADRIAEGRNRPRIIGLLEIRDA